MSLRRRLVVGVLVLLAAAIAATDLIALSSLRSFLYGRLDEQVDVAQGQGYAYLELNYQRALAGSDGRTVAADPTGWLDELSAGVPAQPAGADTAAGDAADTVVPSPRSGRLNAVVLAARLSPDIYVAVLAPDHSVVYERPSGSGQSGDPAPVLPRLLPVRRAPSQSRSGAGHGVYVPDQPTFTAGAVGRHGRYYQGEALAVPGGILLTMAPLAPLQQTLGSLARIELVVSLVVVLAMVALTLAIVRVGLRPLEEMTATAKAIAQGDMRRRIRRTDERSEVGRLGSALNGMLTRIEGALTERRTTESRLRRFVADASHELRTPLTSIRGYAELLLKGALDDEAERRRAAERIEGEAARMGVLVDDLLLLARLDQGRPLERERVDLSRIASEAVDAARTAEPGRPITADLEPGVVVEGDIGRLRQVFDNLLANAAVHTPPGTPVHVRVARTGVPGGRTSPQRAGDDKASQAEVVVADEGPGMSAELAGRIFDRFSRGTEARSRRGTGLGLSIVSALAEAHGGRAVVRTAPGEGAVFTVTIPLAAAASPRGRDGASAERDPLHHSEAGSADANVVRHGDARRAADGGWTLDPSARL